MEQNELHHLEDKKRFFSAYLLELLEFLPVQELHWIQIKMQNKHRDSGKNRTAPAVGKVFRSRRRYVAFR